MLTQEQVDGLEQDDIIFEITVDGIFETDGADLSDNELRIGYYYLTKAEARKGRMQFCLDQMDRFAAEMQKTTLTMRALIKQMEEAQSGN